MHSGRGKCSKVVATIDAGIIDPVQLMGIQQLIVDEYQDLNAIDPKIVSLLAQRGVTVFVAGDDDQSIYSFRFASPAGIQDFSTEYPGAGLHLLEACFRCTPSVLSAGKTLIRSNPGLNRIQKKLVSLYETSTPPVRGAVHRWRFPSGAAEAKSHCSVLQGSDSSRHHPEPAFLFCSATGRP